MIPSSHKYQSTARERLYEFQKVVQEVQQTPHQNAPIEGVGHVNRDTDELDQIASYINSLIGRLSSLIRSLNSDLRHNRYRVNSTLLENACERIQEELNDLKMACEGFDKKIATLRESGARLNHYRIMSHTHITRLRELTTEYSRVLELRRTKEQNRTNREKKYGISLGNIEDGNPDTATEDTGSRAELTRIYDMSRAEGARHVQKAIYEVSQLFQKVNSLVAQQGEMVDSIYADAENAAWNLREGESQLRKYLQSMSSSRVLILKIFGIIVAFVTFFILFVV